MPDGRKKKKSIFYKYQILLNCTFFLVSKPTVPVLLLWNTQTQTGTMSSLDKLESWSITMLSSTTIAGHSPRPVLFKGRFTMKKIQLQKPHAATSSADQAPRVATRESSFSPVVLKLMAITWLPEECSVSMKNTEQCVANLAALKSLLRESRELISA